MNINTNQRAAAAMFPGGMPGISSSGRALIPTPAMAAYASGEYDRALNDYELDQIMDAFVTSLSNDGSMEGGRRKRQNGGGPKLRAACERVKANFKANAAQFVDNVDGAAAALMDSRFGDVRSAMRSAGIISAASTILFGLPNAPFVSSALQTLCSNIPSALYNSAANLIAGVLSAAEIAALGVTATAGLMTFAIMIIALHRVNGVAMGTLRSVAGNAADFIQSVINWNPRGLTVPTVTMAQIQTAIRLVMPRFTAPVPKYKIGIMVITGPNAADLVRSMTRRPAGANVSDLVMKQQGGIERKKSKRKQSKHKRETYSNKKNKKRTTMKNKKNKH